MPKRLGQKARVSLGNAIQTDGSPGGDIGSDLVPEASARKRSNTCPAAQPEKALAPNS